MKIFCLIIFVLTSFSASSQEHTKAAQLFLHSLDEAQKKKAIYPFSDKERFNWNFVPTGRNGISFHDMSDRQRELALALLEVSLSQQGFTKASGIIALEAILRDVEGRSKDDGYRDPQKYYFTIFGNPSEKEIWGWRIEGHHLALNFSSADGVIVASTPSFMGSNPAIVKTGSQRGLQVLKKEAELGFLLVNSLTEQQRKVAVFSDVALPEIVSGNSRSVELLLPRGILYHDLNPSQQKLFRELLTVFVDNYELGFSKTLWKKIERMGYEKMAFAWAGSLQPGKGHYYRLQGVALVIEYDNTQNDANHVHTVVRDLTNDFAEDILKEHYEKAHREN
ncbi:MAG TPA: DUF3500 domain-containing protein [Chryseosolibacter sp.]